MLSRLRTLIRQADPEVVEEWKWQKATSPGVPVWSHDRMICIGEVYKNSVKMTFAKGASLKDPSGLFNSSLEGNARRAIDFHERRCRRGSVEGAHSCRRDAQRVQSPLPLGHQSRSAVIGSTRAARRAGR